MAANIDDASDVALSRCENDILTDEIDTPSLFNRSSCTHKHNIPIRDIDSYSSRPNAIPNGPVVGVQALMLSREAETCPLMDLPREIRNMIYGYLCSWTETIHLSTLTRRTPKSNQYDRYRLVQTPSLARSSNEWRPQELEKHRDRDINILSIQLVSRQVHAEASEILYSTNVFEFNDSKALMLLLERAGPSASYLQQVHLTHGYDITRTHALRPLQVAKNLRTLVLPPHRSMGFTSNHYEHDIFIETCASFLTCLAASWAEEGIAGCVLDVLHFSLCEGKFCRVWRETNGTPNLITGFTTPPECSDCGRTWTSPWPVNSVEYENHLRLLKERIAKKMGIEWDG